MAGGRPSKYEPIMCQQVTKLCRLGATDVELANFFDISEQTLNTWKKEHPQFLESIKAGKDFADAEVADKLFKRATGYHHPEVDIKVINGEIIQTELVKHYPPDATSMIFWLKNRQKSKWSDKTQTELSGTVNVIEGLYDSIADKSQSIPE